MLHRATTKVKDFDSLQSAEPCSQYYTGVAAITQYSLRQPQEREAIITTNMNSQPAVLYRRIGSTTYKVQVHFSDTGTETMGDKIVRLIQNEALTSALDRGILETPQMSQPPEGSSL